MESKWFFSLPETLNSIFVISEITSGLTFKLCGEIGVNANDPLVGEITGPPQLKEYPVDPVGVETTVSYTHLTLPTSG